MLSMTPVALYHGPNPFSDEPILVGRLICTDAKRDARLEHLVITANLPPAWERVLTAKADVSELLGPMAAPEDLIAGVLQQIAGTAIADKEVPA